MLKGSLKIHKGWRSCLWPPPPACSNEGPPRQLPASPIGCENVAGGPAAAPYSGCLQGAARQCTVLGAGNLVKICCYLSAWACSSLNLARPDLSHVWKAPGKQSNRSSLLYPGRSRQNAFPGGICQEQQHLGGSSLSPCSEQSS